MQQKSTAVKQGLYAITDVLIAASLIVGIFTIANLGSTPEGTGSFLKARVTVGNAIMGAAFLVIFHFVFRLVGVYNAVNLSFREELPRVFAASSVASLFALLFPAMSQTRSFAWLLVLYFWISATVATITTRAVVRILTKYIVPRQRDVVIVGSGSRALNLFQEIQGKAPREYRVLGFVDSPNDHRVPDEIQLRMLGSIENLDTILMKRVVDQVKIALPIKSCYDDIQRSISVCERAGVESEYLADVFDLSVARAQNGNLDTRPIVRYKVVKDDYRLAIKRLIDAIGAAAGLVFLSPLMLLVAVAVALTSPGPVLFAQERYGLRGRRFRLYKFRTMVSNANELLSTYLKENPQLEAEWRRDQKLKNDPRVTRIGNFLRRTSLDELPQLINVLRGEMSLVGPRPIVENEVPKYGQSFSIYRQVLPGLTGLWQVSGRSNCSYEKRVELDNKYVRDWSLWLDVSVLARTLKVVLSKGGAY